MSDDDTPYEHEHELEHVQDTDQPARKPNNPTTPAELWGWYCYAWAAEPFIVSAVGTYIPILLEQFARNQGVRLEDHATPCGFPLPGEGTGNGTLPGPPPGEIGDPAHAQQCVVRLVGTHYIDTASFALYTFSFSVLVQTLVVISMSGAADRGKFRKKLLVWFAVLGSLACMAFVLLSSRQYMVAALLAVVSNSCFGAVSVCGNSYLPVLVTNHRDTQAAATRDQDTEAGPLLDHSGELTKEVLAQASKTASKISGTGVALGYLAALIVQIGTMGVIIGSGSTTFSIQIAIFCVGLWWLVFQAPVAVWLRSRPGPPLPPPVHRPSTGIKHQVHRLLMLTTRGAHAYIIYGWKTLFATFKEARKMRDVAIFLLAWFLVSDAATTINSAAVLFARSELAMSAPSLAAIGITTVLFGIIGATVVPKYVVPRIAAKNPMFGVIFVVAIASLIPLYGILGFFTHSLGLRRPWEMYLLASWYGFALGGLNTLCRSIYSLLIPRGKESTFFSLYSVTDKGSSMLGPFVTGFITDRTHNIRYTFYFLFALLVLPLLVFYGVDVERGTKEAAYLETVEAEAEE